MEGPETRVGIATKFVSGNITPLTVVEGPETRAGIAIPRPHLPRNGKVPLVEGPETPRGDCDIGKYFLVAVELWKVEGPETRAGLSGCADPRLGCTRLFLAHTPGSGASGLKIASRGEMLISATAATSRSRRR